VGTTLRKGLLLREPSREVWGWAEGAEALPEVPFGEGALAPVCLSGRCGLQQTFPDLALHRRSQLT
jgi:hypothetical protein